MPGRKPEQNQYGARLSSYVSVNVKHFPCRVYCIILNLSSKVAKTLMVAL